MRKILSILFLVLMISACGPFQDALKSDEVSVKYEMANTLYQEGLETGKNSKFTKAIRLLEQILPQYRSKPQGERLAYMYADCFYQVEDYFDAGYQFERFVKGYPNSEKVEDAAFKSAKSFYLVSPRYSLDQEDTYKAIDQMQDYISNYPGGEHVAEANTIISELRDKLEEKEFKVAELYYGQNDYRSAIKALDNFIEENPGSPFREKAYFYKMDAQYSYAVKSFFNVMEERLIKSKKDAEDYIKYFPEGKYLDKAQAYVKDIDKRLKEFN